LWKNNFKKRRRIVMYYNTEFRGNLNLDFGKRSKKRKEELIKTIEDHSSNWIVEEDTLCWNGESDSEESQKYLNDLKEVLDDILFKNGVKVNGIIKWRGENMGDTGEIVVVDNLITSKGGFQDVL